MGTVRCRKRVIMSSAVAPPVLQINMSLNNSEETAGFGTTATTLPS